MEGSSCQRVFHKSVTMVFFHSFGRFVYGGSPPGRSLWVKCHYTAERCLSNLDVDIAGRADTVPSVNSPREWLPVERANVLASGEAG